MKTRQEMFDQSLAGIRAQGEQSVAGATSCRYRMERDGKVLRCGVGQLIPDTAYDPGMEGVTPRLLFDRTDVDSAGVYDPRMPVLRAALIASGLPVATEADCEFLARLQQAHDHYSQQYDAASATFLEKFETRMAEFAKKYSLSYMPSA